MSKQEAINEQLEDMQDGYPSTFQEFEELADLEHFYGEKFEDFESAEERQRIDIEEQRILCAELVRGLYDH